MTTSVHALFQTIIIVFSFTFFEWAYETMFIEILL